MADEKKSETTVVKPTVEAALEHLSKIEKEQEAEFAGKSGHNPFLWIAKKVTPLREALLENPSEDNIKKALALTKSPPVTGDEVIPVRLVPEEKLQPKVGVPAEKKK